jgi:hypothetical protein
MTLKLRPSGLGSGIDKTRPDFTVFTGGWDIGRIHMTRGGPESALVLVADRERSDHALGKGGDLGRGEGAVSKKWAAWKALAKLDET